MVTRPQRSRSGLVRKSINSIIPSPLNDSVYRRIDLKDPELIVLVNSIRKHGLMEPIVVSRDSQIISGHRRYAACKRIGLKFVDCRVLDVDSRHDPEQFQRLLVEYNHQRVKSLDEIAREEIVLANPKEAHRRLVEHRRESSIVDFDKVLIQGAIKRSKISKIKRPMLDKALEILETWRVQGHLPASVRRLHYAMLNDPPMRNNTQQYENDRRSYNDLSDLTTRAREAGIIDEYYLADETRDVITFDIYRSPGPFIRNELESVFKGYYRDLMQSQPNHIEIVAEKLTAKSLVRRVASDYVIPFTISRGYPSWPP